MNAFKVPGKWRTWHYFWSKKAEDPKEKYTWHLFSDYALLGRDGYPLAVIEAKKTSRNAEEGKLQAAIYAENIRKNNPGKNLPFIFLSDSNSINNNVLKLIIIDDGHNKLIWSIPEC